MSGIRVAGANLLGMALRLISPTDVRYYPFDKNAIGPGRKPVAQYTRGPLIRTGNLQPMPSTRRAELGLNAASQAWTWRVNWPIRNAERTPGDPAGRPADLVVIFSRPGGVVCEVLGVTPWGSLDGWNAVDIVEVGMSPTAIPLPPEEIEQ